tara:strand:- start:47 stop:406 length:360 start_codon:yes stop_codon:yes gene_type:complete
MENKTPKTNKLHINGEAHIHIPETSIPVSQVTEKLTVMITKGTIEGCQLVVKIPSGKSTKELRYDMADTVNSRGSIYFKLTAETAKNLEEGNLLSLEPSTKEKQPKQSYEFKLIKKAAG